MRRGKYGLYCLLRHKRNRGCRLSVSIPEVHMLTEDYAYTMHCQRQLRNWSVLRFATEGVHATEEPRRGLLCR